ncbi:hypothetical protein [Thiolapillus sp.]|nr:hypothetical protein [Thiolapillus sp.]
MKDFGTSVPHMYISSTSISNVLSPSIMVTKKRDKPLPSGRGRIAHRR